MKNQLTTAEANSINPKVLATLGAKKQQVGKTIFKLSPHSEAFLRQLAKTSKQTIREFLDFLAAVASHAHSEGTLPETASSDDGTRMSYAISREAKDTFSKLAHERGVSRDNVVQSALMYILGEFQKNSLTLKEKIEYANVLIDARNRMLAIYNSKHVSEARERLCTSNDQDFLKCEDKFPMIEQLYELDIERYIRSKQDEADKTCN